MSISGESASPPKPRLQIDSLTFNDGAVMRFQDADVVLIVGPNNVGKSVLLRDINAKLSHMESSTLVLRDVTFQILGSYEEFNKWLLPRSRIQGDHIRFFGTNMIRNQLPVIWQQRLKGIGTFGKAFFTRLTTEERLAAANPVSLPKFSEQAPNHPLHEIYLSENLEHEVSQTFSRAFGVDLVINRLSGSETSLHVGTRPTRSPGESTTSDRYVRAVEKLPGLREQGDGMRSFAGVILAVLTGEADVVIIDEPEAFLHPPQARLLGHLLVKSKKSNRQLFLATHSGDFLRGAINAATASTPNLRVLRLTRNGQLNQIRELSNQDIRELWKDPLLRQSNALDGVFHERTIICEADGDCRVFSAVMDALWDAKEGQIVPDVMFTHCGGKDRLHVLAAALRALDVSVRVVVDFDVLRDEQTLERITKSLGGDWGAVSGDLKIVASAIGQKKAELQTDDVKRELGRILASVSTPSFSEEAREQIRKVIAQTSPWAIAKQVGRSYVPSGEATKALERLFAQCRKFGLYIIETGELESFDRSSSGHGPLWVNQIISKDLLNDPSLKEVRQFVIDLLS